MRWKRSCSYSIAVEGHYTDTFTLPVLLPVPNPKFTPVSFSANEPFTILFYQTQLTWKVSLFTLAISEEKEVLFTLGYNLYPPRCGAVIVPPRSMERTLPIECFHHFEGYCTFMYHGLLHFNI